MADILLSVGLQKGNPDFDAFIKDIDSLAQKAAGGLPKISVGLQISAGAMDAFRKELSAMISNTGDLKITLKSGDEVTARFKEMGDAADKAREKISRSFQTKIDLGTFGRELDAVKTRFEALGGVGTSAGIGDSIAQLQRYVAVMENDSATARERNEAYAHYRELLKQVNQDLGAIEKGNKDGAKERLQQINDLTKLTNLQSSVQKAQRGLFDSGMGDSALAQQYEDLNQKITELIGNYANLTDEQRKEAIASLGKEFAILKQEAGGAGDGIAHAANGLDVISSRIVRIFSLAGLFTVIVRQMKEMVNEAISLDSAMTQLRIVADATETEYEIFGNTVADTAVKLGTSITDLIDSATVYARLGYSLDESSTLSTLTAMLQNVGDIDVSSAQSAITAIAKAFNMLPEDIETAMDKLVAVGNNFPISVAELAQGLNNASSALAASGNSFENSIALLTAANTTVQDVAKASTGLRTIAARIRNTKVELEELGEAIETPKYEAVIDTLTAHQVALRDANNEYRSTYDILQDIAAIWDDLSSMDQAAIAMQLAGNRQQNIFYAIITQFQEAQGAMSTMVNAGGTLERSYAKYLDSIQAHVNSLHAAFQNLSRTAVNSDTATFIVDMLTSVVQGLTSIVELLDNIGGILPIIAGFVSTIVAFKIGDIVASFQSLFAAFSPTTFVVGLGITALTAIVSKLAQAKREADRARQELLRDTAAAEEKAYGDIQTLTGLRDEAQELQNLKDSVGLTTEQKERYYEILQEIEAISPRVVEGYKNQAGEIENITEALVGAIAEQEKYLNNLKWLALEGQQKTWDNLQEKYRKSTANVPNLFGALSAGGNIDDAIWEIESALRAAGVEVEHYNNLTMAGRKYILDNSQAIYQNKDAVMAWLRTATIGEGNEQKLLFSPDQLIAIGAAIDQYESYFNTLSGIQREFADELYKYARVTAGFELIPTEQIDAFRAGIANLIDVDAIENTGWSLDQGREAVTEYVESWNRLQVMAKQGIEAVQNGELTFDDFITRFKRLGDATDEVAIDAFVESLYDLIGASGSAANSVGHVESAFDRFTNAARNAGSAINKLQEILKGGDLDDQYKVLTEAVNQARELIENGEFGSVKLGAIADFFGVGNLNPDELRTYFDAMSKYFTEGADGALLFATRLRDMASSGELDAFGARVEQVGDELRFTFDPDRLGEFAEAMGMSEAALLAMLQKIGMYDESFVVDGRALSEAFAQAMDEETKKEIEVEITNPETLTDLDNWVAQTRTVNIGVNLQQRKGGIAGWAADLFGIGNNATGTKNAKRGMSLLGDEWSPNGQPKPELVVGKNGAYLAGTNGPTVGYLDSGDQVYTYDETKKILSGDDIRKLTGHARGKVSKVPFPDLIDDLIDDGLTSKDKTSFGLDSLISTLSDLVDKSGSNSGSGGGGSIEQSVEDAKKEFESLYNYHKHLVAMDQETQEDYLDWLDGAYKDALENGIITLEDSYKYEEEVYKGRADLVKESLNDMEHQIQMMMNSGAGDTSIMNVYLSMMDKVEQELKEARERGLTDDDDYVQELQNKWWSYYNSLEKFREDNNKDAEDAIKDLVQYRIKMIKQELNNEKSALKDKLSYLKEFYDKQKQMLRDTADEEDYQEQQADKRKAVSDIEAQIKQLQFDDSAAAQKRRLQLQEELAKAKKDLADFEKDRALEIAEKQIDTMYENQEAQINNEIDAIDKQLNDPQGLYERALRDVQNNSEALYEEMIEYNNRYGTGIKEDIVDMWEEAYISLKRYHDLYGEYYKGINLVNATGYKGSNPSVPSSVSGYATGTRYAQAGLHKFNENGDELIFTSADGTKYRMFQTGEKVLNAGATNFLYDFATSGGAILSSFFEKAKGGLDAIRNGAVIGDVVMGDIIIQGNASDRTVSEIRRAQRDGVDYLLRKFAQLNA